MAERDGKHSRAAATRTVSRSATSPTANPNRQNSASRASGANSSSGAGKASGAGRSSNAGSRKPNTRSASKQKSSASTRNRKKSKPSGLKLSRIILLIVGCLLVSVAVLSLTDVIANYGKIHRGVSVAGVDIGGLTQDEAAQTLDWELNRRIGSYPLHLVRQRSIRDILVFATQHSVIELDANLQDISGEGLDPLAYSSWRISAATLSARVDGASLAEQAYEVGRGDDFLRERLQAWIGGLDLPATLSYDENQLDGLQQIIDSALGIAIINADIEYLNGQFYVVPSAAGLGIDRDRFVDLLDKAFLGGERVIELPLVEQPVTIDDSEAQALADRCNAAIASPVVLTSQEDTWEVDSNRLGEWIETHIEQDGETARLAVGCSAERMRSGLAEILDGFDPGVPARNASFWVNGDSLEISPSETGVGLDYPKLAMDLEQILFGAVANNRRLNLSVTTLQPEFSTEAAEALNLQNRISTFSTDYGWSTVARATNIQVAAGFVNNVLIYPGEVFSFNNIIGDTSAEKGYQTSKVISGTEYIDELGGGICQVATTIFNAVYDAGYPIVARSPHGLYQWQYPAGRDAAVYIPYLDMKWENNTPYYILLTVLCDRGRITATLWGVNPGYVVKSETGAWQQGEAYTTERKENPDLFIGEDKVTQAGADGRSIVVVRSVYDQQGNLLWESTFRSTYSPVAEILEIGTKQPPPPPPEENPPEQSPEQSPEQPPGP